MRVPRNPPETCWPRALGRVGVSDEIRFLLVRLVNAFSSALSLIQYYAPEVMSFFGSIIVFIVLKRASGVAVEAVNGDALEAGTQPTEPLADTENEFGLEKWKLLLVCKTE